MPNEIVNVNEMERRAEGAVLAFFEYYKRMASVAPASNPLDRRLGDWLDDLQAFLDVDEFKKLGATPPLRETIVTAKIDEEFHEVTHPDNPERILKR